MSVDNLNFAEARKQNSVFSFSPFFSSALSTLFPDFLSDVLRDRTKYALESWMGVQEMGRSWKSFSTGIAVRHVL